MSFSQKCKNELARKIPSSACCRLAELAALVRLDGTIHLGANQSLSLRMESENAAVARKIIKLVKMLFDLDTETLIRRKRRLRKNNVYVVEINHKPGIIKLMQRTGIDLAFRSGETGWKENALLKNPCCRKAYLRGVFLGGGSVNDPHGGSYHLELVVHDPEHLSLICDLMSSFNLKPRATERKQVGLIYLKEADQIIQFLNIIGAHTALLNFESIRVYKDIRNKVNRLVNCETANMNKSIEASMRQIEAIQLVAANMGMEKLSPALRELAALRLEHPDASLKELGEMMEPPLSKSAINHRMRRLEKLAESFRE
ncbi:MAG: DNA-binding protein WhiA [Thermoanaerobacteraceae bacterium]|nr:DNA-binding protein WhiA [Thermoanaerobacteraceae bacterium]